MDRTNGYEPLDMSSILIPSAIKNKKEKVIMKRTVEMLEARINLLRSRKSENGNIIRKIEREIRRLSK